MTDLKEGKPEGKNHPPCTTHSPKPGTGVGLWGPKAEKLDCNSFPLPLLKQLGAAIIRGTRIWTGALLRPTRLALAGAIILWRVPRGIFWSGLGEVRCRGAKGASGLPPTAFTLRPLPPGSPSPLRSVLNLGTAPWGSPTGQAPPPRLLHIGHRRTCRNSGHAPSLGSSGMSGLPIPLRGPAPDLGLLPGCWGPASAPPAGASPSSYSATPSRRSSGLGGCSAPTMF